MGTFLIFATLCIGYYYTIRSILDKDDKEKIFYIVFATLATLLVMIMFILVEVNIINYFLLGLYYFLVDSIYTNFLIITKINEYFLKNQKETEVSLKVIILNLINKELEITKNIALGLIKKNISIDIVLLSIGAIAIFLLLANIFGWLDLFSLIHQ